MRDAYVARHRKRRDANDAEGKLRGRKAEGAERRFAHTSCGVDVWNMSDYALLPAKQPASKNG
jgi:hypothetical protein